MLKLALGSVEAKAILQNCTGHAVGGEFHLPALLPGLGEKTTASLLSEGQNEWTLGLSILGIEFAKIRVVKTNELTMEEVK